MGSLDDAELLLRLEEEDRVFMQDIYPAYKELIQQAAAAREATALSHSQSSGSISTPTGLPAATPVAASSSTSAAAMLKAATALRAPQTQAAEKAFIELSGDPILFRSPLLAHGQEWDSFKATSVGGADPFIAKLPSFATDPTRGNNTLVIRGQYSEGFDGKVYVPVFIGRVPEGVAPATAFSKDVSMHISIRVDGSRHTYTQTFKRQGAWDKISSVTQIYNVATWPLKPGKPFWLRLVVDPRGYFSFLNGRPMCFTPHPTGPPVDGETMYVQLPIAGDATERVTWKATGVWWGYCAPGPDADRLAGSSSAAVTGQQPSTTDLYVTGLRPATGPEELRAAFASYRPSDVRLGTTPGSAIVRINDPALFAAALQAGAERRLVVGGVPVNVVRSLTAAPTPAGGGASGMAGAAAGGGGYR